MPGKMLGMRPGTKPLSIENSLRRKAELTQLDGDLLYVVAKLTFVVYLLRNLRIRHLRWLFPGLSDVKYDFSQRAGRVTWKDR